MVQRCQMARGHACRLQSHSSHLTRHERWRVVRVLGWRSEEWSYLTARFAPFSTWLMMSFDRITGWRRPVLGRGGS